MQKSKLVIVGSGGLAREVKWIIENSKSYAEKYELLGFISKEKQGSYLDGLTVLGDDEWLINYNEPVAAVIAVGDEKLRKKIAQYLETNSNIYYPVIAAESSVIAEKVNIGKGSIIMDNTFVSVNNNIGDFFLCNYGTTIGHDCNIGKFVTLSPGSHVSGNVNVGDCSKIGTGASIIQGVNIGEDTVIGAGAAVIWNVANGNTVGGVPAVKIKHKDEKTLIIAEIGVNHNGSVETAKKMIRVAKECGADIAKFQTAKVDSLVSKHADMAEYQKKNIGEAKSQKEMLSELLLSFDAFKELSDYCKEVGIKFLSTPFDIDSIHFLNDLQDIWKVPSGEINNYPYLVEIAKTHKKVILSTGMSTLEEVSEAIKVLNDNGTEDIVLLHCTTDYPTSMEDVNLNAMITLKKKFGLPVGYSDHTRGIEVSIAATAMGASVIEKHFTLDKNMKGPDHKASIEPEELKKLVECIRNVENAKGNFEKKPTENERKNKEIARKSIVAKKNIKKGDLLDDSNITTKRPGTGINPMKWNDVIGTRAIKDFDEDDLIEL